MSKGAEIAADAFAFDEVSGAAASADRAARGTGRRANDAVLDAHPVPRSAAWHRAPVRPPRRSAMA